MTLRPNHPGYFFIALIAATLMWYGMSGTRRASISVRSTKASLTLVNVPRDLMLISGVPDTVALHLRGPFSGAPGANGNLEVLLDLANAVPGTNSYPIDVSTVQVPPDVEVLGVEPSEIEIDIERLQLRTVTVTPTIVGQPAPGFMVGRVVANPPRLTIQGPESRLGPVENIDTAPIPIEGANTNIEASVEPRLPGPSLRVLTAAPVAVQIEILPQPTPTPTPTPEPKRRRG